MAYWRALILLALGVCLFAGTGFAIEARIDHLTEMVEQKAGGRVDVAAPQGLGFDARIEGTAPADWQALIALEALHDALKAYPDRVLEEAPVNVLIAGQLSLAGFDIGGTVQPPDWVVLASGYLMKGAGPQFFRRAFHHEFSSLLMARHPFPETQWQAQLPSGFSYPTTDAERLAATQSYAEDVTAGYALGFVSDYGMSSPENDINTYAELLMDDPDALARLAEGYPLIGEKTKIIARYYVGLDPAFEALFGAGVLGDL